MERYEGYRITTGFLSGNLIRTSGYDEGESAQNYVRLVTEALKGEFPGAEVNVKLGYSDGHPPHDFATKVYDADGEENPDELNFEVDRIAHQIFANLDQWAVTEPEDEEK